MFCKNLMYEYFYKINSLINSKIECQKCKEPMRLFPLASNASRTYSLSMFTFLWLVLNSVFLKFLFVFFCVFFYRGSCLGCLNASYAYECCFELNLSFWGIQVLANKYGISRNFSEDLILSLLARLLSSLKLWITNNTSPNGHNVVYNIITKCR